jgi:hypothetical protein
VYRRSESGYIHDGEERQLDRASMLLPFRPPMVVGLPFDLLIHREDPKTGTREDLAIPLITFCSELSLALLEELKPYSYRRDREIEMEKGRITITEKIHFGDNLIQAIESPPDWKNRTERTAISARSLEWVEGNDSRLPFFDQMERNRKWYDQVHPLLRPPVPSFAECFRKFLFHTMQKDLNTQDIVNFFRTHPRFERIHLSDLLPEPVIRKLKEMQWPAALTVGEATLPVRYIRRRPCIHVTSDQFKKILRADMILPTGEPAGIILEGRRFGAWTEAVAHYNARLKREIFDRRWETEKKAAPIGDLLDVPFPVAFAGGHGKDDARFEFFTAPLEEDRKVFLVHFFSEREARTHFESFRDRWETLKREFRKSSLENTFREMGWKVKG